MRFVITGSFVLVTFAVLATAEEWSWGKGNANKEQEKPAVPDAADRESKSIDSYSDLNDDSGADDNDEGGASLTNASGNDTDTQPRHLIRDRLCGLGLMEVIVFTFFFFMFSRMMQCLAKDAKKTGRSGKPFFLEGFLENSLAHGVFLIAETMSTTKC